MTAAQALERARLDFDQLILELHTVYYMEYRSRVWSYFNYDLHPGEYLFWSDHFKRVIESYLQEGLQKCSTEELGRDIGQLIFNYSVPGWIATKKELAE